MVRCNKNHVTTSSASAFPEVTESTMIELHVIASSVLPIFADEGDHEEALPRNTRLMAPLVSRFNTNEGGLWDSVADCIWHDLPLITCAYGRVVADRRHR